MKNIFRHKNILIVGLGKSGRASLEFLEKLGAFCYVFDDDKTVLKNFAKSDKFNVVFNVDEDIIKIMDYIILSPSVSVFCEYVKLAKMYGVKVLSELELGTYFARGKIIGITGTNGKTTTSSLIYHILKIAKKSCVLCGNVGDPITANILPYKTNYVVEMSSFQLESNQKIKPNISVITNIRPNHLDRHLSFKNYATAKFSIAKNMKSSGFLVLNFDDGILKKFDTKSTKSKVVWISTKKEIDGFFAKNGQIFHKKGKKIKKIIDFSQTKLIGEHNISNILFATCVCKMLGVKNSEIELGVITFEPLCHRLQFIKNVDGVDYVNDSKSTSVDSTITAINAFKKKPVVLILGGSDKNTSFDLLAKKISKSQNIKHIVVSGKTTKKIVAALKKYHLTNFDCKDSFSDALKTASKFAEVGDTVLLSPACASFDFFESFEKRGEAFVSYVQKLKSKSED